MSKVGVKPKIVVDGVHGDIQPWPEEWDLINTATFQRLRKLKQLQLAYYVYPNATHTRLAHSLGVLHIMSRVLVRLRELDENIVSDDEVKDLRIAALLHDIGHYPYSHLLEHVDNVRLTEEFVFPPLVASASPSVIDAANPAQTQQDVEIGLTGSTGYADHEEIGQHILLHRQDVQKILGPDRAKKIGLYFNATATEMPQVAKLIHSSLDMDRMDYLLRDGQATGVPYGNIDIHYLLNHIKLGKPSKEGEKGKIGISMKALPAAEHFLLGRAFLQRTVCHHKTVHGIEEAAKQLLRRLKNRLQAGGEGHGVPLNRAEVETIIEDEEKFYHFTDAFVDDIITRACTDDDAVIKALAQAVAHRRPPILAWEYKTFKEKRDASRDNMLFVATTTSLLKIADLTNVDPRYFLVTTTKPVGFEKRGSMLYREEAKEAHEDPAAEEVIRVFESNEATVPRDIVEIRQSLLHTIGGHAYHTYRVFFVRPLGMSDDKVTDIRKMVRQAYDAAFELK